MPRPALSEGQIRTRRDEFLDAAQALFESQGLSAVSLRRISARAGCSPTTPYRYFASKDDVLLGLRIRAYDAIRVALEGAAASEGQPADRLRAIARAYIEFALERPDTYALLFRVGEAPEDQADLARAKRDALGVCHRAFAEAESSGDLRLRCDALSAAHLFWAAAHGALSLHLGGQLVVGRTLEQIVPTLISTLLAGLSRPEEEA